MPNLRLGQFVYLNQRKGWRWHIFHRANFLKTGLDAGSRQCGFPCTHIPRQQNRITRGKGFSQQLTKPRGVLHVRKDKRVLHQGLEISLTAVLLARRRACNAQGYLANFAWFARAAIS